MIGYYKQFDYELEIHYSIHNDSFHHEFGIQKMSDYLEMYDFKVLKNKTGLTKKRLIETIDYDKIEKSILNDIEEARYNL
jgi:hypothetical protein